MLGDLLSRSSFYSSVIYACDTIEAVVCGLSLIEQVAFDQQMVGFCWREISLFPPFFGFDFFGVATAIFWVWMLIDSLAGKHRSGRGARIGWFILIFFTQIVGALIYFFVECAQRNPAAAFTYYKQMLTNPSHSGQQWRPAAPPPVYAPPPPYSYPPQPSQPYRAYQQGYQAPEQPPAPGPIYQDQSQPSQVYPQQAQSEEPIATYPEMPLQEQ